MGEHTVPNWFRPGLFRGRAVGITGAGGSVGRASAVRLAELGARLLVIDRDAEALAGLKGDLKSAGAEAICQAGDVCDEKLLRSAVARGHRRFGRFDGWVNTVGLNVPGSVRKQDEADFLRMWQTNVLATWRACRLVGPRMIAAGRGSVVNISSILARQGTPRCSGYTSAKLALEGLSSVLAVEWAPHNVRVNTVVLGCVKRNGPVPPVPPLEDAPQDPAERVDFFVQRVRAQRMAFRQPWPTAAPAEQVADVVLFLLSDAASFMTGSLYVADGGSSVEFPAFCHPRRRQAYRDLRQLPKGTRH